MADDDPIRDEISAFFARKELEERNKRLETENKLMKSENEMLKSNLESQKKQQGDILYTLHTQMDENFVKMEEQEKALHTLHLQLDEQRRESAEQLALETGALDSRLQEITAKYEDAKTKLHELLEYMRLKNESDAKMQSLEDQLKEKSEQHMQEKAMLDRQKAMEIDALKKEMLQKIRETRDTLRLKTRDQLDATTKRTIMENEQMTTELHFQSRETEKLLDRNANLSEGNRQLKRNLLIHKELEAELARRTHVYQKLIRKLHLRTKSTSVGDVGSVELQSSEMRKATKDKLAATEEAAQRNHELADRSSREAEALQSQLNVLKQEYAQYKRDHATMTQLQDQSTRLIIAALYDVKNQFEADPGLFPPPGYNPAEDDGSDFAQLTGDQREYFFRQLLEKLNQSLCTTCVPAGPGSTAMLPSFASQQQQSIGPNAAFSDILASVSQANFLNAGPSAVYSGPRESIATQTEPLDALEDTFSVVRGPVREWGARAVTLTKGGRRTLR
jgi:hypothetical protein